MSKQKIKTISKLFEGSELPTNCRSLKFKAKDGKMRNTDTLDTKGVLRLIESIPSPKAEVFCAK